MNIPEKRLSEILTSIGITWKINSLDYPADDFSRYVSSEYKNSKRYETDETYRMFELTLLHHSTGLRITYTTSESYFGDSVDYKIIDVFVITQNGKRMGVVDVDFEDEEVVTEDGRVGFGEVSKVAE